MGPPRRFQHLVARFFWAVRAARRSDDLALIQTYLDPAQRDLFLQQSLADQRHSIDLCRRLRDDGHDEPALLVAALLHDVGKSRGRLPLPHRVLYSFCATYRPDLARWLGGTNCPRWRGPFYLARHHATIGADAARRAGSTEQVVALIAGHERSDSDPLGALLHRYDSSGG